MTDREKIIKGLEEISDYFFAIYRKDTDSYTCAKAQEYNDVTIDAISMLKKQEPKQVIDMVEFFEGMKTGKCPSCARSLVNINIDESKFCKYCGQAVKWNE